MKRIFIFLSVILFMAISLICGKSFSAEDITEAEMAAKADKKLESQEAKIAASLPPVVDPEKKEEKEIREEVNDEEAVDTDA